MPMRNEEYPAAPECDKLVSNAQESHKIGDFLDWLIDDKGYAICEEAHDSQAMPEYEYFPIRQGFEALLADYFGVDMKKVERERRAILKYVQRIASQNAEPTVSMKVDGEEFMDEE